MEFLEWMAIIVVIILVVFATVAMGRVITRPGKPLKYRVKVGCSNCGWQGEIEIIEGYKVRGQSCPNCRCTQLAPVAPAEKALKK